MRFALVLILVLAPTLALAQAPDTEDILAKNNILIGQLYQALGQAQLQIKDLKKQLDDTKAKANVGKH